MHLVVGASIGPAWRRFLKVLQGGLLVEAINRRGHSEEIDVGLSPCFQTGLAAFTAGFGRNKFAGGTVIGPAVANATEPQVAKDDCLDCKLEEWRPIMPFSQHKTSRVEHSSPVRAAGAVTASSTVPELLPWADPYIAELHREHARHLRSEGRSAPRRASAPTAARRDPPRFRRESQPQGRTSPSRTLGARAW